MNRQDFASFVDKQQRAAEEQVDWGATRDEWLDNLNSLYMHISGFLKEFVDAGSIKKKLVDITLNEENIGLYVAKKMDIEIGKQRVSIEPVGTLLIACKGRVDIVGSAGRILLLLVNKNARSPRDLIRVSVSIGKQGNPLPAPPSSTEEISWGWKLVTRGTQRQFVDLDKDSFYEALMEVSSA